MFDLWYKNSNCIKELWVGSWSRFIFFSIKSKIIIPFPLRANRFLNHVGGNNNSQVAKFVVDSIFDVIVSTKEANEVLLVSKLSMFCHVIVVEEVAKPLIWSNKNASRFLNVDFLAQQILSILGSHIKTKRILLVGGLFTSLWHCHLRITNLYVLVMIYKN